MKRMNTEYKTEKETSRIEAFSDGVFSIAITLLILDIHTPAIKANESLINSLLKDWTSFLAFLIGFFTLLVCWINHSYMFSMIHKSNSKLALANGFKLLVVTITPFATALLSKNLQTTFEQSAVNIYCFNFTLMGAAMTSIWLYAKRQGFVKVESPEKLKAITRLYIFASVLSGLIWVVSYISIIGCLVLFCLMFVIFVFPEKMVALQIKRNSREEIIEAVPELAIQQ
ncbi:MAG: TMEM175 family protein [Ginsengibacter sp.]